MRSVLAFTLVAAIALSACDATPPLPSATPASTSASAPTPSPATAALPIVVGMFLPPPLESPFLWMSNWHAFRAPDFRMELPIQLVYNGLYRYDASLAPVPDLAAEPCDVSADGLTVRCRLVEAAFHDGSPLTADDVVFSYELAVRQPECDFAFGTCVGDMLESVTAPDPRTVEFQLRQPNATFLTLALPQVMIESRAVVETAYAPLAERASTLDPADYDAAADRLHALEAAENPDCVAALEGADELFGKAGLEPLPVDQFRRADGTFDDCLYASSTAPLLDSLAESLRTSGLDAIALAYPLLSFNRAPVGTGPFRFVGVVDGTDGRFEAFAGYHLGTPATQKIEIRVSRDPVSAAARFREGEFQWMTLPSRQPELIAEAQPRPGIKVASFPDAGFSMLMYNLRKGRLFADPNLRAAMELCVDKPETVDAATHARGEVIYSPVDPISWAFQSDLRHPVRDVAEGRRRIETSGWVPGKDGVYTRQGRRLATNVYVLGQDADRVSFMDLVAAQVRDCGIELTVVPGDQQMVLGPVLSYPHIPNGQKDPFDAVFIVWAHALDPDDPLWHSRSISSAEQPKGSNAMGFSDPHVDELLDRGVTTYDQRERARIYRELQDALAADQPVLFGWAVTTTEVLDERLTLTDGEPNLGSRMWPWELEKLVLRDR